MPANTTTKGLDAIASTTLEKVRPTMADNIFKGNPLLFLLYDKRETHTGGLFIQEPLMYAANSTVKYLGSGYDVLDVTAQEGISAATYNWKTLTATISISGDDERKNGTPEGVLNLLKAKIGQAEMSIREQIDKDLLQLNSSKDTNAILGLDEIVDDAATVTSTLGGISGNTYTWWRNQVQNSTSPAVTKWSTALASLYMLATEGREHPDLSVTTKTLYAAFEAAFAGQIRVTSKAFNDGGFENLLYKGMAVVPDAWTQANLLYMLNTNFLRMHVHAKADFKVHPFVRPANQDAMLAAIIWMGAVTTNNRRFQAVELRADNLATWA